MSSKLSKGASNRLLNLLYTTTSTEIATKVPIVSKYLYQQDETLTNEKPNEKAKGSILDGLMENEWKQKPLETAVEDLPKTNAARRKSNILKFNCQNSFISYNDFYNIYPINRERKYYLSDELRKGIQFKVVKARNPINLLPTGAYYLIFPNYKHACVYWLETIDKQINGFDLNFEFVGATANELKYMSSPLLDSSINELLHNHKIRIEKTIGNTPIQNIFQHSPYKSSIITQIMNLEKKKIENYEYLDLDPVYGPIIDLIDTNSRVALVLVRNLPFGLSKHALPKLLWDYELAPLAKFSNCFTTIVNDPINQVHLNLIRFANKDNAQRFVRNFHGRKWESVQSEKEKKFYEPILCEIVD